MFLLIGIPNLAEWQFDFGDPPGIGSGGGTVPYGIPIIIKIPITQVLDVHFLTGHSDAEFKSCSFIKVTIQCNACNIPGTRIPSPQFIYDLIRLAILTDQCYI